MQIVDILFITMMVIIGLGIALAVLEFIWWLEDELIEYRLKRNYRKLSQILTINKEK